ncbi:MAG: hypothetical protein AAFX00_07075 [Pseudomonadota bacterium]
MKSIATGLTVLMLTSAAFAQKATYGELYEEGALGDISNLEKSIGRMLIDNGASLTCLAEMTWADVANINGVLNTNGSGNSKRSRIKVIIQRKCPSRESL